MPPLLIKLPLLIQALLTDPACYDHPVGKIELIETHISWVLLTGVYAYKIKKPVDLGFLDFSTLEKRKQDCLEELRLNRRLAPDYYLAVVAITGSPNQPRIGGSGEILEYAVKMRQFPADHTLDKLAERGELGNLQIDALAARLAHFHLVECAIAPVDSLWNLPQTIARPVEANFKVLQSCLTDRALRLAELHEWCDTEHARLAPLMEQRRVRECHGDLHLANLAWVDGQLIIFDCLEFDPALRWIDVISEVAFCYMDLLHRTLPQLAARFLNAWLEATGDYQGVALLQYYAVYRALVRAKVASLGTNHAEVESYLHLTEQLATHHFPLPTSHCLIITHGLSGSGKTTASQSLLEKHGLIRLRSDVERKRLAGLDARAKSDGTLYTAENSRRIYQYLAQQAERLLCSGWSVIVDAAFLERAQRDLFRELALRLQVKFQIIDIQVEADILRERVRLRSRQGTDASDADLHVLEQQLATARPLDSDELEFCQPVDNDVGN